MPPRARKTSKREMSSGKRFALNMRTTAELRRKLEEAARVAGRSLTQETEYRLERSFEVDKHISDMFGDRRTFALMQLMAQAIQISLGKNPTSFWLEDPRQFEMSVAAAAGVLEAVRPPGKNSAENDPLADVTLFTKGTYSAIRAWRAVKAGTLKDDLNGLDDLARSAYEIREIGSQIPKKGQSK